MATIRFEGVRKTYPNGHVAARGIDLAVADGEFVVLVGPSGCGKSTALRMLAGLETPTGGRIFIDDRDVTAVPPQERDVAMVFQSYALYPHMTVRDNIGFGLRMRGAPPDRIAARVAEVAAGAGTGAAARPETRSAVGRPAPARGARPRDRARAAGVPVRRAALEPRHQAPGRDPRRAGPPAPAPPRPPSSTSPTIRRKR